MTEIFMYENTNPNFPFATVESHNIPREKEYVRIDIDSEILYEVLEVEYIFIKDGPLYKVNLVLLKRNEE